MARGKRGRGARGNRNRKSTKKSTKSTKSSSSKSSKSSSSKSSSGSKNKRGSGARNNRSTSTKSTKSTSTKSTSTKSTGNARGSGQAGKGTVGGGQKSNPTKKSTPAPKAPAPKPKAPAPKAKAPTPKPKPKTTPAPVAKKKEPTKAQQLAKDRIGEGTAKKPDKTIAQVKADNKASMQQKAAERNTKFKQTGVQTLGGKKTTFTKAEEKKITDAGYSVAGYSKAPAQSNTQLQINKDIAQYGNTVPEGSFGISEEGKALAAQQKAEAAAKKAEADKKAAAEAAAKKAAEKKAAEEKQARQFDPSRLLGGTIAQTSAGIADKFAKPEFMYQGNPLDRVPGLSNYFSPDAGAAATYSRSGALKGIPFAGGSATGTLTKFKVPDGAKVARSPLGIRQLKLNPNQMSQLGKGVTVAGDDVAKLAAKGLGKYGARAVPFAGAALSIGDAVTRVRDKDYTGAALAAASAIPGPVGLAALGGLAFKDVRAAMNAPQQVASTQAGGLNISGGVDSGEAPSSTSRAITNKATFGDRLKQSIGAFGTLNQNMSDLSGQPTGPINTVKNLAKSLAVGGKDLSMEDMAASTSFAKAFKDKPLDAVANLNPDGSRRVIKTLKTLDKNKDVSEALANYGGEGFQKGLRDSASLISDSYDKLSTDAKGNRKVVSKILKADDPKADFMKRLAFQQKENPQLSMQSKIKYASDPNFKQYTGTDRQGNKVFENKIKGINRKEMGIIGGLGNFVLSNQGRDVVTGNLPGTNNALDLASNIINTGRDPKSSTYKASQGFLKTIGAGGQPTPGSIIRGVNPFNRAKTGTPVARDVKPAFTPSGGGGGDMRLPQELVDTAPISRRVPLFQVPELPVQQGTDAGNLANIQNESYQSTFKNLMAINPNYSARFQMRRRRRGRRGSFKRSFSRRFFR